MIFWLERHKIISIIFTILITVEIFYFSSLQFGPGEAPANPWPSRAYHIMVFFLFSFFLFGVVKGNKKIKIKYFAITIIISLLHSALDEFHQSFVPFRSPSVQDVLTDSTGIFFSSIIHLFARRNNESLKKI